MMQADSGNHTNAKSSNDNAPSPNDQNDSFERKPLLPQHAESAVDVVDNGNGGGASLRARRRPGGGVVDVPQHTNNLNKNNISAGFNGRKYDKKGNPSPNITPASKFLSSGNDNGERPSMFKIKSIARIGRSSSISIDGDFDHDADHHKEEYYFDDTNDYNWDCSFGTEEENGIWLNKNDNAGTIMAIIVWILIGYSGITITLLADSQHLSHTLAYFYCTICALALASHAKTMFSDPGAVPQCAVPIDSAARQWEKHTMCRACKSYKPPNSHHCRICNRCVSRMDHHCPWMNNCVGVANLKSFILFLCYTWVGAAFSLIIFSCNYFLCSDESCEFPGVLVQLVRVMTVICIGSILFVSSMLANVTFGVMTGSGTIDRLKSRIAGAPFLDYGDDPPLQFEEIFGIGASKVTWFLPTDPVFPDYDRVMGFSMPQRLLREGNENTSIC